MALREVEGVAGAPWERPLGGVARPTGGRVRAAGRQPARRPRPPAAVRLPPARRRARPAQAAAVRLRDPGVHRPARHVAVARGVRAEHRSSGSTRCSRRGACPDAVIVFVDAWTSRGGSQFINSAGDRPLPGLPVRRGRAVHRRALSDARRRAITAGSPASRRAATARWWCRCCVPTCSARSPRTPATRCSSAATSPSSARSPGRCATTSRAPTRCSSSSLATADHFDFGEVRRRRSRRTRYACCVLAGPRPARARRCSRSTISTGRLIDEIWALWLEHDPVRMAPAPRRRAAQHAPDLPRRRPQRRVLPRPRRAGVRGRARRSSASTHTLELFDGKHGGITYRYPGAIRELRARR